MSRASPARSLLPTARRRGSPTSSARHCSATVRGRGSPGSRARSLLSDSARVRLAGLAREALLSGHVVAQLAGLVREVLRTPEMPLPPPPRWLPWLHHELAEDELPHLAAALDPRAQRPRPRAWQAAAPLSRASTCESAAWPQNAPTTSRSAASRFQRGAGPLRRLCRGQYGARGGLDRDRPDHPDDGRKPRHQLEAPAGDGDQRLGRQRRRPRCRTTRPTRRRRSPRGSTTRPRRRPAAVPPTRTPM